MKVKKPFKSTIFIILTMIIFSVASGQNQIYFGPSAFVPISSAPLDKNIYGLELGMLSQKKDFYYLGANVLVGYTQSDAREVSLNIFLTDEKIQSELSIIGLRLVNRFDLTKKSRNKLFIDTNVGVRFANFTTKHKGSLLNRSVEKDVYQKKSGGLSAEFFIGFYVPVKKESNRGFLLKSGIIAGSSFTYIDDSTLTYSNSEYIYGDEKKSNAVYWMSSVSFMINR